MRGGSLGFVPSARAVVISALAASMIGGAVSYFSMRGGRGRDLGLIPEPKVARVIRTDPGQSHELVTFLLVNRNRKRVILHNVSTSCSCVSTTDVDGVEIAPGGRRQLTFRVALPEYGRSATRIDVYHSGEPRPVELWVEAEGRRSLPVVKAVRNSSLTFLPLHSPAESALIVVQTLEIAGTQPWLTGLACDLGEVIIRQEGMTEQGREDNDAVEREYTYRVSWRELPKAFEFSGAVLGNTRIQGEPALKIGRVSGYLMSRRPFSPTVVRLDPDQRPREVVLFEAESGLWKVAAGASLPPWLALDWSSEGEQELTVRLRDQQSVRSGHWALPLVNDRGWKAELEIILRPAVGSGTLQ
jgi:hypothetical protein